MPPASARAGVSQLERSRDSRDEQPENIAFMNSTFDMFHPETSSALRDKQPENIAPMYCTPETSQP